MRVSTLLKLNTLCNLFFGLLLLFIPGGMMALYGVQLGAGGIYMARLAGAAFLGYAALTWLSREQSEAELRPVILPSLVTWFSVGLLAVLYGQIIGTTNFLGWFTVLLSVFFAAGYAFFLLSRAGKEQIQPAMHR